MYKYRFPRAFYVLQSALIFSLLFCINFLTAQEVLPGKKINKDETWRGTLIINGDVVVGPQARLFIEPGTRILFEQDQDTQQAGTDKTRCELIVKGQLIAKGTIDNKIVFSSSSNDPRMGNWYGIVISNQDKLSIIDYAIIEYAYNGLSIKKSNPQISNSQIRFNYNAGIQTEVKAEPTFAKNVISENGYAGIICNLGAKPVLTENLITLNQIGIINFRLSQPNLGSLVRDENYNIGNNRIFENSEYNVYNHSNMPVKAENNSWGVYNRREVINTIYDNNNDSQYGAIDFEPFIRVRTNLEGFAEIIQPQPTAPPQETPSRDLAEVPTDTLEEEAELIAGAALNDTIQDSTILPQNGGQDADDILDQQPLVVAENTTTAETASEPPADVQRREEELRLPPEREQPPEKPTIDYEQVFLEPFLDEKPKILQKQSPVIDGLRGLGAKGIVQVRIIVGKNGFVESTQVLRGLNPYYDRISREAAENFRFKPGTINGRVVRFSTNLFFEF